MEPFYRFRLEIPQENTGRAISDLTARFGTVSNPQIADGTAILTGKAPVSTMRGYAAEVTLYTKGQEALLVLSGDMIFATIPKKSFEQLGMTASGIQKIRQILCFVRTDPALL